MKQNDGVQYCVALPGVAYSGQWSGVLNLSGGQGNPAFEAIEELIGYFARLANYGVFGSGSECLRNTGLDIDLNQSNGNLHMPFVARQLHLGAWRILLQMLCHCHEMEPYQALTLKSADALTGDKLNWQQILTQAYPEPFVLPGIHYKIDQTAFSSKDFSLRIECGREIAKDELSSISQRVDDWGTLVYTGGFTPVAQDIEEELLNKPNTYLLGPKTIEISVSAWIGEPEAISTLLNLALALSNNLPVVSVELE